MKNLILAFAAAFAGAAIAVPTYWAAAETAAANADKSGGAQATSYSGYYCTVAMAEELFGTGVNTVDAVTSYLADNYDTGLAALRSSAASQSGVPVEVASGKAGQLTTRSYAEGQYELSAKYGTALVGSEYLAMLFYDNGSAREFRVMVNDTFDITQGNALFSDSGLASDRAAESGAWTAVTVPEPTGGLLILLGLAGLSLRRRPHA